MTLITIKDFEKGIAESPNVGFADMRNVDVKTKPGVVQIGFRTVSSTAALDLVQWFVVNPEDPTMIFGLGDNQVVYKSGDTGDTWARVTGNDGGFGGGAAFWKEHLIIARSSALQALSSPYTSADWNTLTPNIDGDGDWHPMITAQDDILYGGAGRYIFSLQEVTGTAFAAGTASTYTLNTRALDLPQDERIKTIEELGVNLLVGTFKGTATASQFSIRSATIYPWDRTSDSFDLPIKLNEIGVHQMINVNNLVYLSAGIDGDYYITDGANTEKIFDIPESVVATSNTKYFKNRPGAITQHEGKILFGTSGSTFGMGGQGIWSLEESSLVLENIISTNQDGSGTANVEIGAIQNVGAGDYLVSYAYGWGAGGGGVSYGIDKVSTTRYTDYQARVDSAFIPLGTKSKPIPLAEIEFILVKPLTSGQGVRLKYRTDLVSDFTTINTYDFDTFGAIDQFNDTFGITVDGGVQIRCELTTPAGTASTVELREIIIR